MTRPIIFLGSSLQLYDFFEVCERTGRIPYGIIDKFYYGNTESFDGVPYIGAEDSVDFDSLKKDYDFFIGVNPLPPPYLPINRERKQMFMDLVDRYDLPCVNLIDPQSKVHKSAKLGKGIFVGYAVAIGGGTEIGDHTQICGAVGVGHDSKIGRNVVLQRASMILSLTQVGDNVYVGMGAKCIKPQGMNIGADSFIHPTVTVMRDVEPNEVISLTGRNPKKIYDTIVD